jgi:hypothetical protein
MIQKLPKPPATQRAFANAWAELDYVCKKMRYWLYAASTRDYMLQDRDISALRQRREILHALMRRKDGLTA